MHFFLIYFFEGHREKEGTTALVMVQWKMAFPVN